MEHGQRVTDGRMLIAVHDTLLLEVPLGPVEPQSVDVVAVGALGLDLAELALVGLHDAETNGELLDRDALLPGHFLHQRGQEVPLVEEARHPELPHCEVIVGC